MSSVLYLARRREEDWRECLPPLYKSPLEKLAIMIASVVEARSGHLMERAARLPLGTQRIESRYAWIERFLSTETIDDREGMEVFADAAVASAAQGGQDGRGQP
jgi:hypothetical protein